MSEDAAVRTFRVMGYEDLSRKTGGWVKNGTETEDVDYIRLGDEAFIKQSKRDGWVVVEKGHGPCLIWTGFETKEIATAFGLMLFGNKN